MARISHIIKPALLACLLGLTACVGPDEGGMSSSSESTLQTVSQGLSVTTTFSLEGIELVPEDLRLRDLRFSQIEIVFTSLDGDHEDVVVPIDTMTFDEHGESTSEEDVFVPLPATGRYSVRMQVQSEPTSTSSEDEDDACIGMCFDALVNPGAPTPNYFADSNDGPNPHPFDGGGSAPSKPGGEGDPVAEGEQGDGPNPHPFDGDDGGGAPSEPGGEGDPVADSSESSDTSDWSVLTFESDSSLHLEMGEIEIVNEDSGDHVSITLSINLPDIQARASAVTIEPAQKAVAPVQVDHVDDMAHGDSMQPHQFTPVSAERLMEDARHMNNRGRYYY